MGMNINLPPELQDLVRQKMASGLYTSASEVVCEALRLMEEKDRLLIRKQEQLREDISKGLESGPAAPRGSGRDQAGRARAQGRATGSAGIEGVGRHSAFERSCFVVKSPS